MENKTVEEIFVNKVRKHPQGKIPNQKYEEIIRVISECAIATAQEFSAQQNKERDKTIRDLHNENVRLSSELSQQKELVEEKQRELNMLLEINSQRQNEIEALEEHNKRLFEERDALLWWSDKSVNEMDLIIKTKEYLQSQGK